MTDDDDRLEAALARALGKGADDTAPLSQAVLTRIAADSVPPRLPLAMLGLAFSRPKGRELKINEGRSGWGEKKERGNFHTEND